MPGPGRLLPVLVAAVGLTLVTGCSSGASVSDPSTVAQVKTRLLAPGMAPGFSPGPRTQQSARQSARARPFVPPRGRPDQVCSRLATPASFVPDATLTRMIGRCGHFLLSAAGPGSAPAPASESAARLSGLGDQALYVTVRVQTTTPGLFQAHDWVLIRSGRTLIWIDDQSVAAEAVGKGHDQLTLRLARDAWRHFSAS